MEKKPQQVAKESTSSLEATFLKSMIHKYAPQNEKAILKLLPDNQAKVLESAQALPFSKYPDLLKEIRYWHIEQQEAIAKAFPLSAQKFWQEWIENNTAPQKPLAGMLLRSAISAGANRVCFLQTHPFGSLLSLKEKELAILCDLLAFHFMFGSIHLLIRKKAIDTFTAYLKEHPHADLIKKYHEQFQESPVTKTSGSRFIWNAWNGDKAKLHKTVQTLGMMSLALAVGHNDLLFLLNKRMPRTKACFLEKAKEGNLISPTIIKELREVFFDGLLFLERVFFTTRS